MEFKAEEEGKPFSIIGLTLKAKRNGVVNLIPEFFLARDGLQYHVCRGVRIVKPKPNPRAEAFFPPYDARVWPGHAGDRRIVKAGDAIDIELLFDHIWREDSEILAAVPVAPLRMQSGNTEDAQPESGPVRK